MAISSDDYPELDDLLGIEVSGFGFDPEDGEWYLVFSNGQRLTLSAMGDVAYFALSETLH